MKSDEALPSDLIIEPLKLRHLSMLRAENHSKYLGIFQILLCKKWFSLLLVDIERTSTALDLLKSLFLDLTPDWLPSRFRFVYRQTH